MGHKNWMSAAELPQDPTLRLAVSILMNIIVPKKGSKEQIREEEARILYTLKHGKDLNIAREIVDRIRSSKIRKSTPLCYGMHLMRIIKNAGINPRIAGDSDLMELKSTAKIDGKTLGRLGFKKDLTSWVYQGKGKGKCTDETHGTAGEEEARAEEDHRREETSQFTQPSGPRTQIPSPLPNPQLLSIQDHLTTLSNQLSHFSSHYSERMDYLQVTINSRLDSLDSKIDDLQINVRTCQTHLSELQAQFHRPSPPPRPSAPPRPSPPSQPAAPQPSPPSPPSQPPRSSSPLFSMEDLLHSTPTPPSHPTPPSPQPSPGSPISPIIAIVPSPTSSLRFKQPVTKVFQKRHKP